VFKEQFVFGTYMVAEFEVSKGGDVRVRRVICASSEHGYLPGSG
jgi:hypothetical protein